ncbi:MAG: PLD nuclease N-terminal domain-containing protein [Anaerolineales bacterium]
MDELRSFIPLLLPLLVIELTLLIIALVDLIRREQVKYLPKWAWAVIIVLLNFIGPIAYLLLGREEG